MELRKNIITALLIAVGFILSQIIPGIIVGMKFDLMLSVMFVCLLINKEFKNVLVTAFLGGVITAMTTTFPGGQLPNLIDKFITCMMVYFIIRIMGKFRKNLLGIGMVAFIGTLISGSVFLTSASMIVGLPAKFKLLFMGIVLPTAFANVLVTILVYKAVNVAMKISKIKFINE
ncbi:tryptophan transporter [Lutibacter sp. B2]|nr:tryptophan transporter [Lutibacter sp. B2]